VDSGPPQVGSKQLQGMEVKINITLVGTLIVEVHMEMKMCDSVKKGS